MPVTKPLPMPPAEPYAEVHDPPPDNTMTHDDERERAMGIYDNVRRDARRKTFSLPFHRVEIADLLFLLQEVAQLRDQRFEFTRRAVLAYEIIQHRALQQGYHP